MSQTTIGIGIWKIIRGYLNSMFTELYAAMTGRYVQVVDLNSGDTELVTTLPDTVGEPYSVTFLDSTGKFITNDLGDPVISTSGGYYHVTVYSYSPLTNVKLKILY